MDILTLVGLIVLVILKEIMNPLPKYRDLLILVLSTRQLDVSLRKGINIAAQHGARFEAP